MYEALGLVYLRESNTAINFGRCEEGSWLASSLNFKFICVALISRTTEQQVKLILFFSTRITCTCANFLQLSERIPDKFNAYRSNSGAMAPCYVHTVCTRLRERRPAHVQVPISTAKSNKPLKCIEVGIQSISYHFHVILVPWDWATTWISFKYTQPRNVTAAAGRARRAGFQARSH